MMADKEEEIATNVVAVEEEKYAGEIYFSAGSNSTDCHWYVIKSDTKPNEYLSPAFRHLQPNFSFSFNSSCVFLDRVLYVVGGYSTVPKKKNNWLGNLELVYEFNTNEVHCIDTLHPENGWIKCPPMSIKRSNAYAFTLDSKIYVLGGFTLQGIDSPSPFHQNNYIEFFDPCEKDAKWHPYLPGMPYDILREHYTDGYQIGSSGFFVRMVASNEIPRLFKYDYCNQSWNLYANDFGPYQCQTLVIVDDILFSYDNFTCWDTELFEAYKVAAGTILCFDVNKPKAKPKELMGLDDFLPTLHYSDTYPTATLLHLSGHQLCLLWEENYPIKGSKGGDGDAFVITCLKFTVSTKVVSKSSTSGEGEEQEVDPKPSTSGEGEEQEVDFVASNPSKSSYYVDAVSLVNTIAVPPHLWST